MAAASSSSSTTTASCKEDLISRLPDDILIQILSFLPTGDSIATSLLSKRWKHVWISVPNLDFHSVSPIKGSTSDLQVAHFANFVDRVFRLLNINCNNKNVSSPVFRKIHLDCSAFGWKISPIFDWISVIVSKEAEMFDLRLPFPFVDKRCKDRISEKYSVPLSFFNRGKLVKLKLVGIVMEIPPFVCFPSLVDLEFVSVHLVNDDKSIALKNLLSGCPVLKTLQIDQGFLVDNESFCIFSSTLRDLKLDTGSFRDKEIEHAVAIEAPNLRNISLTSVVRRKFDLVNVPSLVKASLSIGDKTDSSHVLEGRLRTLLREISHVKELILVKSMMNVMDVNIPLIHRPMFYNLTFLDVELCGSSWRSLLRLFQFTPNLVDCCIIMTDPVKDWSDDNNSDESDDNYNSVAKPRVMTHCLLSSIENVKICHRDEGHVEMGLIRLFLKYAIVLKMLLIQTVRLNSKDEANFIGKLQKLLNRSGGACQVKYRNMRRGGQEVISLNRIGKMDRSN